MTQQTFTVTGMTCGHCEKAVVQAIKAVDPQADVHTLRFIRRCRELGFPMKDIASLVNLWHDQHRSSANVQDIARRHLHTLAERIAGLQAMQRTLQGLIGCCHGDERPECPILDELANPGHPAMPGQG